MARAKAAERLGETGMRSRIISSDARVRLLLTDELNCDLRKMLRSETAGSSSSSEGLWDQILSAALPDFTSFCACYG